VETASVLKEIERLRMATVGELQDRYLELFGQRSRSLQNPLGWADQKRWCLDPQICVLGERESPLPSLF
jgi:hypothetical protein